MASQTKRRQTRIDQRNARGTTLHPRGLARSVAKFINREKGSKENEIKMWREYVMGLPKKGKSRIHPKMARKCHKIDT